MPLTFKIKPVKWFKKQNPCILCERLIYNNIQKNKLSLVEKSVENILKNDTLLEKVLEDSKIAKSEGINLIPTIVLSSGEKIEGSQSIENYLEIMNFEAK